MMQLTGFIRFTAIGAVVVGLANGAAPAAAQGARSGGSASAQGSGATGLETIKIRDNVHVIFGAGGNITVHEGEDGLILVDAGTTADADAVVRAVRGITDAPMRLIINTSADPDHIGGNEVVSAAGFEINPDAFAEEPHATVLAHENVLTRLSMDEKVPTELWPSETFTLRVR